MKASEYYLRSEFSEKKYPLNNGYSWIDSLTTDVTEDFVSVKKLDSGYAISLKLYVEKNYNIQEIILYFIKCGDEVRLPLSKNSFTSQDIWNIDLSVEHESMLNPFSYRFKIISRDKIFFLDAQGKYKYKVNNDTNFKFFYSALAPRWIDSAIIYHIFIDRFSRSSKRKDLQLCWGDLPTADVHEFYGGDLDGIIERLDYLLELGITAICLTPIFKASTNHRYDVEDYYQVDPNLGGNKQFELLCIACRNKNIRIILDGVFNHVSGRSPWFNRDSLHSNDGAYQSDNSEYFGYFNFTAHPDSYDSFWGDGYLPKLNYQSSALRGAIYGDENSIIKYWLAEPYAISGWRLDACCMLGKYQDSNVNSEVLTELTREARRANNDCYIFGENPFDPSEISQFSHMDGITNYAGFYTPLISWLDNSMDFDAADLDFALTEFRALMGFQFSKSCKTFLGNHDKKRLYGVLGGDRQKYFTALTLLFTYPGVPSIYYGEEVGLHSDFLLDDSRICMQWDFLNKSHYEIKTFTKNLISLFKSSKAIQHGSFVNLYAKDNIFIYERFIANELILVVLNNSVEVNDSILVTSNSLSRLAIFAMHSCLDKSLSVEVIESQFIEIKNIKNNNPIIISSINSAY